MSSNFKLLVHHNSENLHLKLMGDFDFPAAALLMKSLQKHHRHFRKIFIHTSCLDSIESAATKAFQHSYDLSADERHEVVFTGDHAENIAPHAWQIL